MDGLRRLKQEDVKKRTEEVLAKWMIQEDELRSEFEDYLLSWEPTKRG